VCFARSAPLIGRNRCETKDILKDFRLSYVLLRRRIVGTANTGRCQRGYPPGRVARGWSLTSCELCERASFKNKKLGNIGPGGEIPGRSDGGDVPGFDAAVGAIFPGAFQANSKSLREGAAVTCCAQTSFGGNVEQGGGRGSGAMSISALL